MAPPLFIGVELTSHCNLRCGHCLRADTTTRQELSIPLLDRILEQARVFGRPHLGLTGGEPTLHSRFFAVLERIAANGLTCSLTTNALRLPDLLPRLAEYQSVLPAIAFSLDGATAETHDALRGRGNFDRMLLALAMARYCGFQIIVQSTVNRRNQNELSLIPPLCHNLGVDVLYFCHTQPTPALYAAGLQLSPDEWLAVEAETHRIGESNPPLVPKMAVGHHHPGVVAPCWVLQHRALSIDAHGRLTFCCQLSGSGHPNPGTDVLADLTQIPLATAYERALSLVDQVLRERLARIHSGTAGPNEAFQCWYCQKRFGKLDWLRDYPTDPWVTRDPDLSQRFTADSRPGGSAPKEAFPAIRRSYHA